MYQHYVAVDWAMSNMAIAKITSTGQKPKVFEGPSDIQELKAYLKNLHGSVCLALEESTSSQWLYVELKDLVDRIIVCDPFRNKLLSEGGKTDKIDAVKLVMLLKANLLKEVFHSTDELIELRKLVSGYDDLVRAGVRLKNQRSALFRNVHRDHKKERSLSSHTAQFVLKGLDLQIERYEEERLRYLEEFKRLKSKHADLNLLSSIPGIGDILAIKIVATVVDIKRFPTRNNFFSYCGLVKIDRVSGGRLYGKRNPRFSRTMKSAMNLAAVASWDGNHPLATYHEGLLHKGMPAHNARNALARKIATTVYGVLKHKKRFDPEVVVKLELSNRM